MHGPAWPFGHARARGMSSSSRQCSLADGRKRAGAGQRLTLGRPWSTVELRRGGGEWWRSRCELGGNTFPGSGCSRWLQARSSFRPTSTAACSGDPGRRDQVRKDGKRQGFTMNREKGRGRCRRRAPSCSSPPAVSSGGASSRRAVAREALQCARTRRGRVGVVERVVLSE
jgi:hypothetical protein